MRGITRLALISLPAFLLFSPFAVEGGAKAGKRADACVLRPPGSVLRVPAGAESTPDVCPASETLHLEEAKRQYQKYFPETVPRISAAVFGTQLSGTEDEFRFARDILQDYPGVAALASGSECRTLVCFLSAAFGSEESAYRALAVAARQGYIISLSQRRNPRGRTQVWSPEEVRLIDEATDHFPEPYRRLPTLKYFYRMHPSVRRFLREEVAGVATPLTLGKLRLGRGAIRLYELAFSGPREFALHTITHEVAHHMDFMLGEHGGEWRYLHEASGLAAVNWSWSWKFWRGLAPRKDAVFMTEYGKRSPKEDFADLISYYMNFPRLLEQHDPRRYRMVRERIFSGHDFSGSRSWPALDRLIDANGGDAALLRDCAENILIDGPTARSAEQSIVRKSRWYYSESRPLGDDPWFIGSRFPDSLNCVPVPASSWSEHLAGERDFCLRGRGVAVDAYLRERIIPWLELAGRIYRTPPGANLRGCWEKNDFTRGCMLHAVAGELPRGVQEELARMISPPDAMLEALFARVPPRELMAACGENFGAELECAKKMHALLAERGIRLDPPSAEDEHPFNFKWKKPWLDHMRVGSGTPRSESP